jgi:biopolymer transport protein TolR
MGMNVASGKRHGVSSEINITPLIDVVLVLLIIFMVLLPQTLKLHTATIPRKDQSHHDAPTRPPIVLKVDREGQLSLDARTIPPADLREVMIQRLGRDADKVVFFEVDDDARYGAVVRFMDVVKGAGARKLAIVTKD